MIPKSNSRYTVSGGTFTATIPARSAIALFTGAIGTGSGSGSGGSVTVAFQVYAETTYGDVGSIRHDSFESRQLVTL